MRQHGVRSQAPACWPDRDLDRHTAVCLHNELYRWLLAEVEYMPEGKYRSGAWRVAVLGFDHMHAGDQLRLAAEHPSVELTGAWDDRPSRGRSVLAHLGLPETLLYTDVDEMLQRAS